MAGFGKTFFGAAAALALCSSSSFAAVATSAPAAVNPFAVIGAYGSPASVQALCGNAATAAVAGAAAVAQAPAPGCVLPVVDAAPVVADTPPPPPPVAAAGGIGIWPVLLALGALAGLALLISGDDDDDDDEVPVSA